MWDTVLQVRASGQGLSLGYGFHCSFPEGPGDASWGFVSLKGTSVCYRGPLVGVLACLENTSIVPLF